MSTAAAQSSEDLNLASDLAWTFRVDRPSLCLKIIDPADLLLDEPTCVGVTSS
jgi:hypothetical protein